MSRWQRRVARIKTDIDIIQVLTDYGYAVRSGGGDREQQFSCDLHGDGRDQKPSGRVYPASASWYCFTCAVTRDAIETVRTKEGLDFKDALNFLEKKYGLPTLPWEDADRDDAPKPPALTQEVSDLLANNKTFEDDMKLVKAHLYSLTVERTIPQEVILPFWEAFDAVTYLVTEGKATEQQGRVALAKVATRIREALKALYAYVGPTEDIPVTL